MRSSAKMFSGIFILFFFPAAIVSAIETTIVTSLQAFRGQPFKLVHRQELINDWKGITLANGIIDSGGNLHAKFNLDQEGSMIIFIGNTFFRIWMIPGESLAIRENASGKKIFEGKAAIHNNFLIDASLASPVSIPAELAGNFNPEALDKFLDETVSERQHLYNELIAKSIPSELFKSYVQGEISGYDCFTRAQYPMSFIYQKKTLRYRELPAGYFTFWNSFKILEDGHGGDMYMNALREYIAWLALSRYAYNESDRENLLATGLKITDSILKNKTVTHQKLQAIQLDFLIKYFSFDSLAQAAISDFATSYPASAYTSFLNDRWGQKKNVLMKTINFQLKDLSDKLVNISKYKGKLIYVDFWGSWCKACIAQFEHSRILRQQFAGKDIVFLFIDFYDDARAWKSAIKKYRLEGEHLKADKSDEAFFNEKFGIGNGFPRYALIDQSGILRSISAPHPNDPAIVNYLNSFLQ